jgi:DNA-binding NarL/FixJ family response regulator
MAGHDGVLVMGKPFSLVIAEDHTILREGLKALFTSQPDFEVVGEAEDGIQAIRCVQTYAPDIILMDLSMPKLNGLEAIKEVKRLNPATKIIVLTVHSAEEYVLATLEAGADGYVLKDANRFELLMAMNHVLEGKRYLSPGVSEKVIDGYLEGKKSLKGQSAWESLTQREREILKLIAEGYKNKEIADTLCISQKTVEKHRTNLMTKLDLHNVAALTSFAIEKGLVSK